MVKQNPKEKLNNKAAKMIDLALDEVFTGGEKSITASFRDSRYSDKKYILTVTLEVEFESENSSSNDDEETPDIINPSTQTDVSNNTETPSSSVSPDDYYP